MKSFARIGALLALLLALPQMSGALPRPPGSAQTAPEEALGLPFDVLANDSFGVESPLLADGRTFRFEVTEKWYPSGLENPNNIADTGFETTDGTNWGRTGKGLIVGSKNYGSDPSLVFMDDHKYSLQITGRGIAETMRVNDPSGHSDNDGKLTVQVYEQKQVNWVVPVNVPVGGTVPATQAISVTPDEYTEPYRDTYVVTGASVPINHGGMTLLPQQGSITLEFRPNDTACPQPGAGQGWLVVTFFPRAKEGDPALVEVSQSVGPLGCWPAQRSDTVGIGPVGTPPFNLNPGVCPPPGCPITLPPSYNNGGSIPIWPGTQEQPIPFLPSGSSVEVLVSWQADNTKLWPVPFPPDDVGVARYVAPFRPTTSTEWYLANLNNVGATFSASLYGPNRQFLFGTGPIFVPGIGQFIESAFASTVMGQ